MSYPPQMPQSAAPGPPERLERKPRLVTAAQVVFALLAIPMLLVPPDLLEDFQHEAEIGQYRSFSDYMAEQSLWPVVIAFVIVGLTVVFLHSCIVYGLGKGRRWARILGFVMLAILALPMGLGALAFGMFMRVRGSEMMQVDGEWVGDPFAPVWLPILFWGLCIGTVLVIAGFVLLSTRDVRAWTPERPTTIVVLHRQG